MENQTRIHLADYLLESEFEIHILVGEEDSARADWWRASCGLHDWYTTGSRPNVEDAAAHHVAWDHPACATVDPDSPADTPVYCRMLPGHSDDHANGGRCWANDRKPTTTPGRASMTKASACNVSHYFATDSDREAFLALFGNRLDVWFTPEFAAYVRTGRPVHERRIPDIDCPKCGHDNVSMRHCFGDNGGYTPNDRCRLGDPEHFHRHCGRCSYRWRTNETPMDTKEGTAR